MKQFKNIVTIFLAGLLMMSTVGITMNKHYCMGRLKNVAVFEKAMNCAQEMGIDGECPKNCCNEESEEFRVTELTKVGSDINLTPDLKLIATLHFFMLSLDLGESDIQYQKYNHYKPPLIEQDIPVFVQSFLI